MTETDTDLAALYKAILQVPAEDTPRLIYADRLDEIGGESNAARADFIRSSIELHNLGKEPITLVGNTLIPRGQDYYETIESIDEGTPKVGDRVDVDAYAVGMKMKKGRHFDQLLVTKIQPDDAVLQTIRLSLKQDEQSVPYPKQKALQLQMWVERLWLKWEKEWRSQPLLDAALHFSERLLGYKFYHHLGQNDPAWVFDLRIHRGFPSEYTGPWGMWALHGDVLTSTYPISRVCFNAEPQIIDFRDADEMQHIRQMWPTVPANGWILPETE